METKDLRKNLPESAEDFMQEGLKWHSAFLQHAFEAKRSAAYAGAHFQASKHLTKTGDWADWCRTHSIPVTTADRYIAFAQYCVDQGRISMPGLDDEARLLERGIEATMASPRAWTSLLRYTGFCAKLGQYDPEGYAARKARGEGDQFDFGVFLSEAAHIRQVELYFDRIKPGQLDRLEQALTEAINSVRAARARQSGAQPEPTILDV